MHYSAARILKENKEAILNTWFKNLVNEIPSIKQHETSAIKNSIPRLLEALITALNENKKDGIIFHSQRHGLTRAAFKDYSLGHIIKEYNLLKATIFAKLDEHSLVNSEERDLVMYTIDQAIEQAGDTYYKIKSNVLIDAREIAEKDANVLKLEDENREEFIQSITHDLNNPLNNIKACIDLIEDNINIKQISYVLQIIKGSTGQAISIVEEFLNAGSIEGTKKLPIEKVLVNVLEDIDKELQVYRVAHDREIELKSNEKEVYAYIDIALVRRAFNNLIHNALKHGEGSEIAVGCEMQKNELKISVYNSGHIPEEVLNNIFNRYYKTDNVSKGWGIGLSFVKKVAEAHGGNVVAKSYANEGTTFTLTLPN